MSLPVRTRVLAPMLALGLLVPLVGGSGVDAGSTRTKGTGRSINLGWTEYDPDDLLGLPGNVHVGYLWMENGQWGDWGWGGVVDFDCEPGEVPWGHGGGHEAVAEIAVETASVVESATEGAIDDVVDAGGSVVDAAVVVDTIGAELTTEVPEEIIEEVPACDFLQERILDPSDGGLVMKVDLRAKKATLSGTITVVGGHGPDGEPGAVLGRPPVDITITGGEWTSFEYSYKARGAGWSYSDFQQGQSYGGGTVTGRIGGMGFADDADDESHGWFAQWKYRTVERVR